MPNNLLSKTKLRQTTKRVTAMFVVVFALINIIDALFFSHTEEVLSPDTITPAPTVVELQEPPGKDKSQTLQSESEFATVVRVVDGDTLVIDGGRRLRLIGIDAPESVHPNRPVACFGKESSDFAKQLLEGKTVRLVKDVSETDRFGRLLRYVWIDGLFVNEHLVKEGYATAVTYPPDVKYQEEFRAAEKEARENNKGLWHYCNLDNN
jgi:endonuclease YncB( thermonuclease family)